MLWKVVALSLATVVMTTSADANGSKRTVYREREVVHVYEPRAPIVSLGVLGSNLIIWDDLHLDLFGDDEAPRIRAREMERRRHMRRGYRD